MTENPNEDQVEKLSERLTILITRRNMSQIELADMIGIAPSTLSRVLNGKRPFSTEMIEKLAGTLGLEISTLVAGTDYADTVVAASNSVPKSEFDKLTKEFSDLNSIHQALVAESTGLREGRDQMRRDLSELRNQSSQKEQDLLERLKENQELREEQARLEDMLLAEISRKKELGARAELLEIQLQSVQEDLKSVTAQLERQKLQNRDIVKTRNELQQQLSAKEIEKQELLSRVKKSEAHKTSLELSSKLQSIQISQSRAQIGDLHNQLEQQYRIGDSLREQLQESNLLVNQNYNAWLQADARAKDLAHRLEQRDAAIAFGVGIAALATLASFDTPRRR